MTADGRLWRLVAALMLAAVFAAALAGCRTEDPAPSKVGEAVPPVPWNLADPESAVRSYLDWVAFSYRMANSEIPTATMTAGEAVRVDAYIQLNRIEGKGIEQSLDSFELTSKSLEASSAVVTTRESWRYRYFSLDTLAYLSEELTASYETTYTLMMGTAGWLVDRVEASSEEEVQ